MKEKLLQFFTGKMSKSIYIAIASAFVCGAVVITSTVIVHNNNQKIDSVLEGLSASENVPELSSESLTESISTSDNINTQGNANGEPAGDKALQYLAEYNALTEEYERKRAELENQIYDVKEKKFVSVMTPEKPQRVIWNGRKGESSETIAKRQKEFDDQYERELREWEKESQSIAQQNATNKAKIESENSSEHAKVDEAQRKLDALDAQYEKDVAALKARYGIA